ncbi:MAG: hypothetical protein EPN17_10990 [Methylobacter sp.]|nr:MAG: hypothetical protein EPN17_10990 [Methylobacter sp.]
MIVYFIVIKTKQAILMKQQFDLVFEGGGAKGIIFVGALKVLLEQGHSYRRLIGTSAGAITATLCAAGYSPDAMLACINERTADGRPVFSTFMDKPTAEDFSDLDINGSLTIRAFNAVNLFGLQRYVIRGLLHNGLYTRLFSFVERGGFYSGRTFLAWMQDRLAAKGYDREITLEALFNETQNDLSLVATNVGLREMLVLNHRTTPNLPVARAVRMSMSIPFVWEEVIWDAAWQYRLFDGTVKNIANTRIIDGGVLSNFPMELIAEHNSELVQQTMGDLTAEFVDAALNLGLLIDEDLPVADQPEAGQGELPILTELPTLKRVHNLAETMMSARNNRVIDQYQAEICRLPAKGYGTLEFGMEGKRLDDFIKAGYEAMTTHLQARGLTCTR